MRRSIRTNRVGVSLVELMVTMSACAVLLTLSLTLLHRMLHVQKRASAAQDIQRTLWRLESVFRSDIHAATAVIEEENTPESVLVLLSLAQDQSIEYRREAAVIERLLLTHGEVTSRERFAFSQPIAPTISRRERGLISLEINSNEVPVAGSPITFQVTAVLSRDRIPAALTLVKEVPDE